MSQTPAQQWSALSALYEEADALPAPALAGWLARLEQESHPLLPQLKRMLEARSHMETDNFLGTMPRLSTGAGGGTGERSTGQRVGPYRLVRPLGEGGMAEVWLAQRDDGAFKRQVAIKLPYPRPGRETFALRFDRERDILATLRHPHIAALFDAGVTPEGQAWLALEYVEGQPISTFCDERRLPLRERVMLFRQVLLAVQHAHANLVIHRDLKPANILVTPQGEVRLLDFGIAKLLEAQGDAIEETELTRQAGRSMTPRYASPEQLLGLPLTTACDVYSLGVVFYELMCGERPYELKVESVAQLEHAILEAEPRAPSRRTLSEAAAQARGTTAKGLSRALAPELDAIALRCLGKQVAARYSSVDALLADVDRWLSGEAVLARAPGAWYRLRKFAGRHRIGVGLGAAGVVSLAVVAAAAIVMGFHAREESSRAAAARDFMLSLFSRADQEKSRGADITARELLETGRKDVLARLGAQPRLQSELLHGIANIQEGMGEYLGAGSTFADLARVYADLGMQREAAMAFAAQANAAIRSGDARVAEQAVRRAKEALKYREDDAELAARLGQVEGWISVLDADMPRANILFEKSYVLALRALGPYHVRTIDALRGRIFVERQLRHFDRALEFLQILETTAAKSEGFDERERMSLIRDRAELLFAAGKLTDSFELVQGSQPQCVSALGPHHLQCKELTFRKADIMLRMGRPLDDSDVATLEAIAKDERSRVLGADTLLVLLRLDTANGWTDRAASDFDRVKSLVESDEGATLGQSFRSKAFLALAEARLRTHDPVDAQRWIRKARAAVAPTNSSLSRARVAMGNALLGIALLESGRSEDALDVLYAAKSELSELLGPDDLATCFVSLNVAASLEALGRTREALETAEHAASVVQRMVGGTAPTYQRVADFVQRLRNRDKSKAGDRGAINVSSRTVRRQPPNELFF